MTRHFANDSLYLCNNSLLQILVKCRNEEPKRKQNKKYSFSIDLGLKRLTKATTCCELWSWPLPIV